MSFADFVLQDFLCSGGLAGIHQFSENKQTK